MSQPHSHPEESSGQPGAEQPFANAEEYRNLEAVPAQDTALAEEDFAYNAEDVIATLRQDKPVKERIIDARQNYVEHDDQPRELAQQANLMLTAGMVRREEAKGGSRDREALSLFNSALARFIYDNHENFTLSDVTEWVAAGAEAIYRNDSAEWADGIVRGAVGELAAALALLEHGVGSDWRKAPAELDSKGVDLISEELSTAIDIKTRRAGISGYSNRGGEGGEAPVEQRGSLSTNGKRYRKYKVAIPADAIGEDFRLSEDVAREYADMLSAAI